jgi:drug/metabolite transporter (DMT)-like permease
MLRTVSVWFGALSDPAKGVVWMLLAAFCLTGMAVAVRVLSQSLHTFEIVFFRTALSVPFMLPWLFRAGIAGLRTQNTRLLTLRAVMTTTASTTYFWGLKLIPLADATAIMFTRPIFAAILAMIFLHEIVGGRRWTAMAAGFSGVLIMTRPGLADVDLGVVLVLVSAIFAAAAAILVRRISRTDSPDTITMYQAASVGLITLVPAILVWRTPGLTETAWVLAMAFLGTLGQRALARSFAAGEISFVLPFDFTRLIFAAGLGYALFGESPVIWTWIGGTVIFAATIFLARRGRREAKP